MIQLYFQNVSFSLKINQIFSETGNKMSKTKKDISFYYFYEQKKCLRNREAVFSSIARLVSEK